MRFTNKPALIFYEKTGCMGNAKQKKLLRDYKVPFETKSLLDTAWSSDSLRPFFEGLEPQQMINSFAPQIKNHELDISKLSKEELIELMVETPILIKRPLLVIGKEKICGFDVSKINRVLGLSMCESLTISSCPSQSEQSCTPA